MAVCSRVGVVFLCLIFCQAFFGRVCAQNLIPDGDFESEAGLTLWKDAGRPNCGALSTNNGDTFLRIKLPDNVGAVLFHRVVTLTEPVKKVEFRARIRKDSSGCFENHRDWEGTLANLYVSKSDDGEEFEELLGTIAPFPTSEWTDYSRSGEVPPGTRRILIELGEVFCTGAVDFDDVSLLVLE